MQHRVPYSFPPRFDSDDNGKLDLAEMTTLVRDVMGVLDDELPADDLAAFVRSIDTNGDGTVGLVFFRDVWRQLGLSGWLFLIDYFKPGRSERVPGLFGL